MAGTTIVVAVDTCNVSHNGTRHHITRGEAWAATDPLVKAYPGLFTKDARYVHRTTRAPGIETATRAPGEKRPRRPRKKTAKTSTPPPADPRADPQPAEPTVPAAEQGPGRA